MVQVQLALDGAKEVKIFNIKDGVLPRGRGRKQNLQKISRMCCHSGSAGREEKQRKAVKLRYFDQRDNYRIETMKMSRGRQIFIPYRPDRRRHMLARGQQIVIEAEEAGCKECRRKGMLQQQGSSGGELFIRRKDYGQYNKFQAEQA